MVVNGGMLLCVIGYGGMVVYLKEVLALKWLYSMIQAPRDSRSVLNKTFNR